MVLKRTASRIAAITWVLIFGGILMLALGLVVRRTDAGLGWGISAASITAIVVGVGLVWWRSRLGAEDKS
jgi:xanthine/uracil/vitamin C permease (AzgA family)